MVGLISDFTGSRLELLSIGTIDELKRQAKLNTSQYPRQVGSIFTKWRWKHGLTGFSSSYSLAAEGDKNLPLAHSTEGSVWEIVAHQNRDSIRVQQFSPNKHL